MSIDPRGPPPAGTTPPTAAATRTRSALIVDSSRLLREVCGERCRLRRLEVLHACDVVDALGVVCSARPTLVLTALELPGMPGSSLLAAIRSSAAHRAIPIGLLSATDSVERRVGRFAPDVVLRKDADLPEALDRFLDTLGIETSGGERGATSEAHPLHGRILLAEDSPTNSALLGRVLHVSGADVTCVENGAEALLVMDQASFELVLMDIEMPMMDGRVATRMLRTRGVACPILALTGHDPTEFAAQPDAADFDGILHKPIKPADLIAACRTQLAGRRAAKARSPAKAPSLEPGT